MKADGSPPLRVIVNPASSGGKGARFRRRVEQGLARRGIPFELQSTRGPGHAVELARASRSEGARTILVVGGDGTIHEVARGLLEPDVEGRKRAGSRPPELAVVPVGTGNDFYRMITPDSDLDAALDLLVHGRAVPFDVGVAAWNGVRRPFVNLFGVGIDVEVLRQRRAFARLPGLAQYLSALLAAVVHYRPIPIRVRVDDEWELAADAHLASVTVGPSAGGGFLLNPDARPDDGELDLCFIEGLSYLEIMRYIPKVIRGTHGGLDVVSQRGLRRARIERGDGRPFPFQLDGELVTETTTRVELEVLPGALDVQVPMSFPMGAARGPTV